MCHPLYGFFLLPGHLGGSIEHGPKLSQSPTSNFSKVKATTVVVAVRDHEEEEVGTNPYEEGAS